MNKIIHQFATWMSLSLFLLLAWGSQDVSGIVMPNPKVISDEISYMVYDIEGEPDAGYRVTLIVQNDGRAGEILIEVSLFCTEGTFKRKDQVTLQGGEAEQFIFDFPEPTQEAQNIKYFCHTAPAGNE